MAVGCLNGLEVDAEANWKNDEITGRFTVSGEGAAVIAGVFQADTEAVYSGPVRREMQHLEVVVTVTIEVFPCRSGETGFVEGPFVSTHPPVSVEEAE